MEFNHENIQGIALIFEQANGNILDANDIQLVNKSGLTGYTVNEIEAILVESIKKEKSCQYRGLAYWVLGKRFNKKLLPKFRAWLKYEVESNETGALYQLMIALDNLEEPIFGCDRAGSYSAIETELNLRDSINYIKQHA